MPLISKRDARSRGRRAWIRVLVERGDHAKAQAFARKHGLVDHLARITNPQGTAPIMLTSEGCATLSPSPTLSEQQALAQPGTPGGAGVRETPGPQNEDQSRPPGKNSQLEVAGGVGAVVERSATVTVAPGMWPDAEDGEPEMLAALAGAAGVREVPDEARCAALTEAERPSAAPIQCSGGIEPPPRSYARERIVKTESVEPVVTLIAQAAEGEQPWPEESEAWVVRELPNPRLLLVRLPDGRMASCWRAGRRWVPKAPVRVKLEKRTGDVIYQPV